MKKYAFNEITTLQYISLINGMTVSFGFIEIPADLHKKAGTGGLITLLLGTLVTMAASLIVVQMMKRFPDGTILDMLTHRVGKWAGRLAAVVIAAYFLFYGYVGIVYSTRVIKARILQETPAYITLFLLLIPTYVVARNGFRVLGRYAELSIWLSLWIPFVFLLVWKHTNWNYLFPLLERGWLPILKAVPDTFFYFLGFFATTLFYPFLQKKEKAAFAIVTANGLTMLSYLFIMILSFIFFSPEEMKEVNQPSIYMLKTIELRFIEQVEGLFIVMYMLIFSMSWIPPFLLSAFCAAWLSGRADHRPFLRVLLIGIAMFACFYVPGFNTTYALSDRLTKIGTVLEYALPVLLLLFFMLQARIARRRSQRRRL